MRAQVDVVTLLLNLAVFAVGGCNPCSYGIQREIRSPSGKMVAVVYQVDCGATTDFATILSIKSSRERFSLYKNNNVALGVAGQETLSLSWQSDTELTVAMPTRVEIRTQKDVINGVTIHYQSAN